MHLLACSFGFYLKGVFLFVCFFFQMVMPGDIIEMTAFQDKTISNSHYVLELMLPNIHLTLPNKSFYEKLYNRQV